MPPVVDSFKTKVGPLPLWAWTAVPAGAYVIYAYWKRKQEPEGPPLVVEDGLEGDEGANQDYLNTGLPSIGPGSNIPGYQAAPEGTSNLPQTNDAWYYKALSYMTGQGKNPAEVAKALGAYIYGVPATISQSQLDIINETISKVGAPPMFAQIPSVTQPTTTTPSAPVGVPAKPTGFRIVSMKPSGKAVGVGFVWNAPIASEGQVTQYILEREHVGNPGVWARQVVTGTATSATVVTAVPVGKSARYNFRLAAVNAKGISPYATVSAEVK